LPGKNFQFSIFNLLGAAGVAGAGVFPLKQYLRARTGAKSVGKCQKLLRCLFGCFNFFLLFCTLKTSLLATKDYKTNKY